MRQGKRVARAAVRGLLPLLAAAAMSAQEGFDHAKLESWKDGLAAQRTTGLLVIRRDKIVYEWYAPGWDVSRPHSTASLAKALVGGLSLLVALNDGRLRVDDPASLYIPAWRQDASKSKITIRRLATHSSGIEDAEQDNLPHDRLTGWKGDFWKRTPDPFSIAVRDAPVLFPPGQRYQYSNPGMAALAYAVTASLKGAPQSDIRALLAERIMRPLGVADSDWSIGYGRAYDVDGLRLYATWGGGSFTARAAARIGQLMLHQGRWEGRQLVDAKWVAQAVAHAGTPVPDRAAKSAFEPGSGLCWWTNFDGVWPSLPRDAFAGAGAGHQLLLVVPSLALVVVRNGDAMRDEGPDAGFFGPIERHVYAPLIAALAGGAPPPPSRVIRKVVFAPKESITRQAIDSDNWPVTWADNGHLYTSYGDGWGFEPRVEKKLSLGFARVEGQAKEFRGVNIRSRNGERAGDGAAGLKASGMLMVGGVLYMWVRNAGNSQLWWSEDHARTWRQGFRFEESFGSPTFLNFGRNYEGARDGYAYVYSQDGPSAYESYDGVVMARVRKDRIRERGAYEYFAGLDKGGRPNWTNDIGKRGAVFTYAGRCQRADAVYNPGIKRYLLALGFNHGGAWGLFDAPEPWGPWSTAFLTEDWGLGGTHGYRLPSKWISTDGATMFLLFSGVKLPDITYDAFCVRKMTLEVAR